MKIARLEPFILHAPVTRGGIADSTHTLTHWGAPGVAIHTDAGLTGYGFSGTHAQLATDRLITDCIVNSYGPLLVGQEIGVDPTRNRRPLAEAVQVPSGLLGGPRRHHASGARRH